MITSLACSFSMEEVRGGRGRGNGSGGSDSFGLPNQSSIPVTRARYIFVKDVVFDKRNRVSEADPRSFAACKKIFFLTHGYSELLVIWVGPAHFLEKITMIFVLHSFIIMLKTLFR